MFFTDYQKSLAYKTKTRDLEKQYRKSEKDLKQIAKTGNEIDLLNAMRKHGNYEYALLFQKTPEFKVNKNRGGK